MIYTFDDFELDEDLFELRGKGRKIAAQPKVLQFLLFVVRHHPQAVHKKTLIESVWGDIVVTDAALARVVMEVRKALSDADQQKLVTVRGRGFRMAVDVEVRAATAVPKEPGLIGREPCMAALSARLEDSLGGHRRFALVFGPPGMGKTRVLEDLARIASARGASVYGVRCREETSTVAYWPWLQLARAHLAQRAEPAMERAIEALARRAEDATTPEKSWEIADVVTRAFATAAAARPLALSIDDVHFADPASLELLQFFVRDAGVARILVVAAHRDPPASGETRAAAIRELLSDSGTLSIPLRGLSVEEVARLIESVTKAPPSSTLAVAIHKRSGGIPHYVHQLLETTWAQKALEDHSHGVSAMSSIDLQPGIVESITRHLEAISAETREVLVDAALVGHEFAFTTLAAATGMVLGDLHERLDEAVGARLVAKKKNDTYQFSHALVADVLGKTMPSAARTKRHRAIAERLLKYYGDAADLHAVELAHHFVRALSPGDPEHAIAFSIRAAQESALLGANAAAVKNWANASRALGYLQGYDARRSLVQIELARARNGLGDRVGAREACLDGVLLARAFRKPEALVDAALLYAELSDADDPRREMILAEGIAALDEIPAERAEGLRAKLGVSQDARH